MVEPATHLLHLGDVTPSLALDLQSFRSSSALTSPLVRPRGSLPKLRAPNALHLRVPCPSLNRHSDSHRATARLQVPLLTGIVCQSQGARALSRG